VIVVMGLYRGGSSAVAGVLHHLGVCMGHELKVVPGAESPRYVAYEDWPLRRTCLQCYTEREMHALRGFGGRVQLLYQYLADRISTSPQVTNSRDTLAIPYTGCDHSPMGAKFPSLCYMGHEIVEAWGADTQFVAVDRDLKSVVDSARRWYGDGSHGMTHRLYEARESFLATREHVRVRYESLVKNPALAISRIADGLGLDPSDANRQAAINHVARPTYAEATS